MTMPSNTTKFTDVQVSGDFYDANGNTVAAVAAGVTSSAAELNILDGATVVYQEVNELSDITSLAQSTISVGAEGATAANCIRVTVQLKTAAGVNVDEARYLRAWLSSSATTGALASAPTGGTAVGTAGAILKEDTAEILFQCVTNTAGKLELDITDSGTPTVYLWVAFPNGKCKVSSAITFA